MSASLQSHTHHAAGPCASKQPGPPVGVLRASGGRLTTIAHTVIRVTGPIQVVLGLLLWGGLALSLLPLHMAFGMGFVVALWTLAVLAALRGLRPLFALLVVGWGLMIPVFGIVQTRLLPGPHHWAVRVIHLVVGLAAMVMAARLVRFIRSNHARGTGRFFVPAAGRHWRLPFYDLVASLLGADAARRKLVQHADIQRGECVLDVGAGTGALALEIKGSQPLADVTGIDPDPRALGLARRKAERARLSVRFDQGFADSLPYPAGSFDRVTSSFVLHHLAPGEKTAALGELRRVLRPGGRLHLLDFDGPRAGDAGFLARRIHASAPLRDNDADRILEYLTSTGFEQPKVVGRHLSRVAGTVLYEASA
jgi:ubiquinone/menaquinone biosynthesis C-methylase UbiE